MIGDVAGLGAVLLDGPILALLGAVAGLLFGLGCYGMGRRSVFRQLDGQRAAVREAYDAETARHLHELVPGQREASQ